jgi:phosphoribosyl 1,2-cyclic phosphodiesterase
VSASARARVLTYERCEQYEPHRSQPLATQEAQELAAQLGIPLWTHVRHNMTAVLALADVFTRQYDVAETD